MTDPEPTLTARLRRRVGQLLPLVAAIAVAAGVVAAAVIFVSSRGDDSDAGNEAPAAASAEADAEDSEGQFAVIRNTESSWVAGQGSLVSFDGYLAVANRADDLARTYQEARDAEVARQERLAGLARKQAQQAARRRALAAYRAALRRAKRERERQKRLLAERRRRIKERLQELREKYKVPPGEECQIPEVAAVFDCETGYPF